MLKLMLLVPFAIVLGATSAKAEPVGCVNTTFRMLGMADDKICIDSFRDPKVDGVVCHVSRAKTGGVKGALGIAEDTSDASIACRQVGPITLPERVASKKADGEQVFKQRTSLLFKTLQVVRFYDATRNALVYLTYSDKLIEGSPKNSVTAVPIQPWGRN